MKAASFVAMMWLAVASTMAAQSTRPLPGFPHMSGVQCVELFGDTIYVGGEFDHVYYDRPLLVLADLTHQEKTVSPPVSGTSVEAVIPDGNGGWFIAGRFRIQAGPDVLAAHVLANGAIDAGWATPPASASQDIAYALALQEGRLLLGGSFGTTNFEILDAASGLPQAGAPALDGAVQKIAVSESRAFLSGTFSHVDQQQHERLCSLSLAQTIEVQPWKPDPAELPETINALGVVGEIVYAVGGPEDPAGEERTIVTAIATTPDAAIVASQTADKRVTAAIFTEAAIQIFGPFYHVGETRANGFADLSPLTLEVTATAAGAKAFDSPQSVVHAASGYLATGEGVNSGDPYTGQVDEVYALTGGIAKAIAINGTAIAVGGSFSACGVARPGLAALVPQSAELLPWTPDLRFGLTVTGLALCSGQLVVSAPPILSSVNMATGELQWELALAGSEFGCECFEDLIVAAGDFKYVTELAVENRIPRKALAAFAPDGTLLPWNPQVQGEISSLVLADDTLYAGGQFNAIDGIAFDGLARIALPELVVDSTWAPAIPGYVNSLAVAAQNVLVGLWQQRDVGVPVQLAVQVSPTGVTRYFADVLGETIDFLRSDFIHPEARLFSGGDDTVYIGGNFMSVGAQPHTGLASWNPVGGVRNWRPNLVNVTAVKEVGELLYVGADAGEGLRVYGQRPDFAPPHDLAVASRKAESLRLVWSDNSTTEDGFQIWMAHEAGAFSPLLQTPAEVNFAKINGLTPNTRYRFVVSAFRGDEAAFSNKLSVVTEVLPPALGVNLLLNYDPGDTIPLGASLSLNNPVGFGHGVSGGSRYRAEGFYVEWLRDPWDNSDRHLSWNSGQLNIPMSHTGSFRLRIYSQSHTGRNYDYTLLGPFYVRDLGPSEGGGEPSGQAEEGESGAGSDTEALNAELHSGDSDADGAISLSEMLRVVQFFTAKVYSCAGEFNTEDGYIPGSTEDHTCSPHDTDYDPQDWRISLSELMRLVQLYNNGSYTPCEGAEDGYCLQD